MVDGEENTLVKSKMAKKKLKTIWEATDVKTGRQLTLWFMTIVIAVLLGNNIMQMLNNIFVNAKLSALLYIPSLIGIRVIMGYLFD